MSISIRSLCGRILKVSANASVDALSLTAISVVPIAGPIAGVIAKPILKELVDVAFEQMSQQTSQIDQKLDQMMKAHYKVGIDSLKDASMVDDRMRESRLQDALREFIQAANIEIEVVRQARSMFYVGACYSLLGQHRAALRWYEDAYRKGQEHLAVLRQRVDAETVGHDKAVSFKAGASAVDDAASSVSKYSPAAVNRLAAASLRAGPYGAIGALFIVGAGYATLGAIKGGKAIADMIEASKAGNLSEHERELVTFHEHFLRPLEQLLQSKAE